MTKSKPKPADKTMIRACGILRVEFFKGCGACIYNVYRFFKAAVNIYSVAAGFASKARAVSGTTLKFKRAARAVYGKTADVRHGYPFSVSNCNVYLCAEFSSLCLPGLLLLDAGTNFRRRYRLSPCILFCGSDVLNCCIL